MEFQAGAAPRPDVARAARAIHGRLQRHAPVAARAAHQPGEGDGRRVSLLAPYTLVLMTKFNPIYSYKEYGEDLNRNPAYVNKRINEYRCGGVWQRRRRRSILKASGLASSLPYLHTRTNTQVLNFDYDND